MFCDTVAFATAWIRFACIGHLCLIRSPSTEQSYFKMVYSQINRNFKLITTGCKVLRPADTAGDIKTLLGCAIRCCQQSRCVMVNFLHDGRSNNVCQLCVKRGSSMEKTEAARKVGFRMYQAKGMCYLYHKIIVCTPSARNREPIVLVR